MKKYIFITLTLNLFLNLAHAEFLACEVKEWHDGKSNVEYKQAKIDVTNAHGDILNIDFKLHEKVTGYVSFQKGFAVMSISDQKTQVTTSTIGDVSNGKLAQIQMMIPPMQLGKVNAIQIECKVSKLLDK